MRTELILAVLVSSVTSVSAESLYARERWTLALPGEVTLVGLTGGVRPEVLYRFGDPGTRSRVRVAIGFLDGPEQFFLPVSLGYRAIFRQPHTVQPHVGAGVELQHRLVSDAPAVRQLGLYVEGGVGFAISEQLSLGLTVALDVMFYGGPGAGLGPRLYASWRL